MTQTQLQKAHEERLDVGEGLTIFVRSWRPEASARGVVVIVPGFNSHSGYYSWAAEQLVAGGLGVYAVGLRGGGQSDGERILPKKDRGTARFGRNRLRPAFIVS